MPFLKYNDIKKKIIYYNRDYIKYTKCLIRHKEICISGHPEEEVRQCLLYYLINELQDLLSKNEIKICVEENNLDISIFKVLEIEKFQPHIPPLIIIETKKLDVDISFCKRQVLDYMFQNKCNTGLITNLEEAIILEKNDSGNISEHCMIDGNDLIIKLRNIQNIYFVNELDIKMFHNATNGDINSFIFLINSPYAKQIK